MRAWMANRPAMSFYLLTLTLSWGYWLMLLAKGLRVRLTVSLTSQVCLAPCSLPSPSPP
jgi:hypothetical protein